MKEASTSREVLATIARWSTQHSRSLLFSLAILVVGGVLFTLRLPVGLFPQVSFPRVVVALQAGDRPAEEMTVLVTIPAEEALRAVPAVRSVRSTTSRGSAEISVNFDWGTDMVTATLQIEAALAQATATFPAGATSEVRRMDPTVFPVLAYSLRSEAHSDTQLYDLAYYRLRPRLATVKGVAGVRVVGGAPEEIHVIASVDQLARFGLTIDDVSNALAQSNAIVATGVLEDEHKIYLVIVDSRPRGLEDLRNVTVRSGTDGLVRLDDIALVSRAALPQRTIVTADGARSVLFQVYQQPGGNTVQIARDVKQLLATSHDIVPSSVTVSNWYDQSELILASANSVRDAVLIGVLLAMIVLFLFLRSVRITMIAAVVVPSVLSATALFLGVLGQTLNLMTLGGMAAAVGLIIDDAIVMVEHIFSRLSETARFDSAATPSIAMEFTKPLVGSSAATIVIFTPLAFLSGVTGAFFRALSLTMALSLIISFFVAWLIVPKLTSWLVRERDARAAEGTLESRTQGLYERLLRPALNRPALLLLALVPLVAVAYHAYRSTGSGFMPPTDEGGFVLDYRSPPGTSLAETDRLLRQVEGILQALPELDTYSRRTGLALGGGLTEANEGDFFVRLLPPPRRPIHAIMDDVRQRIAQGVPGLEVEMAQLMEDLIGDLTAVPQPIEIQLFGGSAPSELRAVAATVADQLATIAGVVEIKDGVVPAGDALVIRPDPDRSALEGLTPMQVAASLTDMVGGALPTSLPSSEKVTPVRVWIPEPTRNSVRDLEALRLTAPAGNRLPVRRVATTKRIAGQPQITRKDLKTMIAVTGRISGRDMGSTVRDVLALLRKPGLLPAGVNFRLGGLYEQQQIAFRGLLIVLGAAIVLVFGVLLLLYESFRIAAAMLCTTGLAFAGVYIGLWLTGTETNISSMMGMTMIVGIVTEVSIFYVTAFRELPQTMDPVQRLLEAGKNRLRPIAMTTLAAILALLPLALGLGQGSGMLQPLAIAIEAGLTIQFPLVLGVLPVLLAVARVR